MENNRIRITKMLLKEALIKALKEKNIARVTVTELCELAQVNRTTYYKYYTDPFDQLSQISTEFYQHISEINEKMPGIRSYEKMLAFQTDLCEYYLKNRDLFLVLMEHTDMNAQYRKLAWKKAEESYHKQGYDFDHRTFEYVYTAVTGISYHVIWLWLVRDWKTIDAREVASFILDISYKGINRSLSIQ